MTTTLEMESDAAMTLTLEVPLVPVSGNKWQRMHWGKRKCIKASWLNAVYALAKNRDNERLLENAASAIPQCVDMKVTVYCGGKGGPKMDAHDNLRTGLKPAFDAIVECGLLWDDSERYLRVESVEQVMERDPKKHRTVFTFTLAEQP